MCNENEPNPVPCNVISDTYSVDILYTTVTASNTCFFSVKQWLYI